MAYKEHAEVAEHFRDRSRTLVQRTRAKPELIRIVEL